MATAPSAVRTAAGIGFDGEYRIDVDALHKELSEIDRRTHERSWKGWYRRVSPRFITFWVSLILLETASNADWKHELDPRHAAFWVKVLIGLGGVAFEVWRMSHRFEVAHIEKHTAELKRTLRVFTGPGSFGRTLWDGIQFGAAIGLGVVYFLDSALAVRGRGPDAWIRYGVLAEIGTIVVWTAANFHLRARQVKWAKKFVQWW